MGCPRFWELRPKKQDSEIWQILNTAFVIMMKWSWLIYALALICIAMCFYYSYLERCELLEIDRRRRIIQREEQRPVQKRRPYAAYRDHQIHRHIIVWMSKYMINKDAIRPYMDHMEYLANEGLLSMLNNARVPEIEELAVR